jgi:DNA modification methylase
VSAATTSRVLVGDCRQRLAELPERSIHCCITSPPYWGLRDYGVAGQLGLEAVPDCLGWATGAPCGTCYVCHLVEVFRSVRRTLRDDGTVWLNLGDSYSGSGPSGASYQSRTTRDRAEKATDGNFRISKRLGDRGLTYADKKPVPAPGLKPKDLVGIPWRVALALQADGWTLRSEIVWAKKSCMPESVRDRPTRSHEQVFLLSKGPRYYYDATAVAEEADQPIGSARLTGQHKADAGGFTTNGHGNSTLGTNQGLATRNLRSVWTLGPSPFPDAHFATFVPEIPRRAILAGTSERGCCPDCGAGWVRVVDRKNAVSGRVPGASEYTQRDRRFERGGAFTGATSDTLGWSPACRCDAGDPVPCTVLDPFAGAGTTGLVADRLGRSSVLIELNPEYAAMSKARIVGDAPLFANVAD